MAAGLNDPPPRSRTARRRWALAALALGVVAVHGCVADWLGEHALDAAGPRVQRMEVAFVRELKPAEPPRVLAPAPPPRQRAAPAAGPTPEPAASAPEQSVAPAPETPASEPVSDPPVAAASEPALPATASDAAPPAVAAASPDPSAVPFDWPPSTRLDYLLEGQFRGPVHGHARVQWLRAGERYQVHLDVEAGLVLRRRMTSDGSLSERGLTPRRYDEETETPLRRRVASLRFDPAGRSVQLANGNEAPVPEGVQDTASQFVQLTWLFTTRPELLQAGRSVDLTLALPRRVDMWRYDVVREETVQTPMGPIAAWYVKPQRPERPGAVISAEIWFAPSLQYLPIRIRLTDGGEATADLTVTGPPQQAER